MGMCLKGTGITSSHEEADHILVVTDIERSHRLGPPKDREGRERTRPVIVRFRSERLRDSVYRARTKLKSHNIQQPDARIFVNEDLTARRAS